MPEIEATERDLINEVEELLAKATPGPWERGRDIECQNEPENCWHTFDKQAEVFPPLGEAGPVATVSQVEYDNAALIAAAPELLRRLVEEVKANRETLLALHNCQNKPVCGHCNNLLRHATRKLDHA